MTTPKTKPYGLAEAYKKGYAAGYGKLRYRYDLLQREVVRLQKIIQKITQK